MSEKTEHIYDEHHVTEGMVEDTQTVFLVDRETKHCFAYLSRWPFQAAKQEWSVWRYDPKLKVYVIIETGRTYEACLMFLGARSAGQELNFGVWYSNTAIPNR